MKFNSTISRVSTFFGIIAVTVLALSCSRSGPVQGDIPDAPSGLTGLAVGSFTVQLYWSDNSDNEDSFAVYRSTGGPFELAGMAEANMSSYLDEIQVSCVEASYYVVAENASGQSPLSNRITVPLICVEPPGNTVSFSR